MFETRSVVSFDGTEIAYHLCGRGDRTLVIANGHGATRHVWEDVCRSLIDQFRIVIWDYRGQHGSRDLADERRISIDDHARDCEAILDTEGIEKCLLAGWSLGVQVALQVYRRSSSRIEALALIHGAHDQLLHRLFGGRLNALVNGVVHGAGFVLPRIKPVLVPLVQRVLQTRYGFAPLQAIGFVTTVTPGLKQMALELVELDMSLYMRTVVVAGSHRSEPWLHEVDVPVLITGGRADWLTPEPEILRAFERLPNATYHQFDGTHFPLAEEPDRVAELLVHLDRYATADDASD